MSGKSGVKSGINWKMVNLNQPTEDICREFCCSRRSVMAARRRLGIPWPEEERKQGSPFVRKPHSKTFGVTLKHEDAEKLLKLAERENMPPSRMARILLEAAIRDALKGFENEILR